MSENKLAVGANIIARRNKPIAIAESDSGALMCHIGYESEDCTVAGTHKICIGARDGTIQERNLETIRDVFGGEERGENESLEDYCYRLMKFWQDKPLAESAEFSLADWHNEPWTNKKGEKVDSYLFRWLNRLGSGTVEKASDEALRKIADKWGAKIGYVLGAGTQSKPKTAEPEPAPAEPAKRMPGRPRKQAAAAPEKPKRGPTNTAEEVYAMLSLKRFGVEQGSDEQNESISDEWYDALDSVLGKGNTEGTAEQWNHIADKLGL